MFTCGFPVVQRSTSNVFKAPLNIHESELFTWVGVSWCLFQVSEEVRVELNGGAAV